MIGNGLPSLANLQSSEPFERACLNEIESNCRLDLDCMVVVVRSIRSSAAFASDPSFAGRFGKASGREIAEHISKYGSDPNEVMVFADQAEFVASFLRDVLLGRAWTTWFYGPFRKFRGLRNREAILTVMQENSHCLADTLTLMRGEPQWESLLQLIGSGSLGPWRSSIDRRSNRVMFVEPVFDCLFRIADQLGWWRGSRPEQQGLVEKYCAVISVERADSFAGVAADVVRFLLQHRLLSRSTVRNTIDRVDEYAENFSGVSWMDCDQLNTNIRLLLDRTAVAVEVDSMVDNSPESLRPIFAAALRITGRLGIRHSLSSSALFETFISGFPTRLGWSDKSNLMVSVAEVIGFLLEQQRSFLATHSFESAHIDAAVRDESWLDTEQLSRLIIEQLESEFDSSCHHDAAPADEPGQSPRQPAESPTAATFSASKAVELVADDRTRALRPVFAAALRITARIGIKHSLSSSALFESFISGFPTRPGWSDKSKLTASVSEVIGFLLKQQRSLLATHSFEAALIDAAVRDESWLDTKQLSGLIIEQLESEFDSGFHRDAVLADEPGQRTIHSAENPTAVDPSVPQSIETTEQPNQQLASTPLKSGERRTQDDVRQNQMKSLGLNAPDPQPMRPSPTTPSTYTVETSSVSAFLLARAIQDLRLHSMVQRLEMPADTELIWQSLLIDLGLRWSGVEREEDDAIDPGLLVAAGAETSTGRMECESVLEDFSQLDIAALQFTLLRQLVGMRLMKRERLHVHRQMLDDSRAVWIGGDATTEVWPLVQVVNSKEVRIPDFIDDWTTRWVETLGCRPDVITSKEDAGLAGINEHHQFTELHAESHQRLAPLFELYGDGCHASQAFNAFGPLLSSIVVRAWAKWLKQFTRSSHQYLLDNFLRRPGRVTVSRFEIVVYLEPRPLDVVLSMSGYTSDLENVSWLGNRPLRFRIGGGR